jgi:hypothetical protein
MKVELELGSNLRMAIDEITKACRKEGGVYSGQIGSQIREAFGINFSELLNEASEALGNIDSKKITLIVEKE